jgi:hypothetical protein
MGEEGAKRMLGTADGIVLVLLMAPALLVAVE